MPEANVEADPLFQLLTDALRAGPGSASWIEAVEQLRQRGGEGSDEYRLLVAAREHLESGKEYRSVRAGPGFTRKLFENIETDDAAGQKRSLPTATIIALLSAIGIVVVLAVLGWQLMRGTPQPRGSASVVELENAYFPNEVASATFDSALPANWQTYGQLPLEAKNGLRPVLTNSPSPQAVGGAVVAPEALAPSEPFAAEARLKLNRPTEDVIVEVFVSAGTDFSASTAASSQELVWLLRGSRQQVVLGEARRVTDVARPEPGKSPGEKAGAKGDGDVTVRILFNRDAAIVECNGQRIWSGAHGLPPDAARHVGVRFLRTAGSSKTAIPATVQSVQVLKK